MTGVLTLHGHTAARAEIKLRRFIEDATYARCRCLLVITGKGAGVLKGHVPEWLKRPPLSGLVLALAEAAQQMVAVALFMCCYDGGVDDTIWRENS